LVDLSIHKIAVLRANCGSYPRYLLLSAQTFFGDRLVTLPKGA